MTTPLCCNQGKAFIQNVESISPYLKMVYVKVPKTVLFILFLLNLIINSVPYLGKLSEGVFAAVRVV